MLVVLIVIAALIVVVVALVAVGGLTGSLAGRPRTSVYDRAEAVEFVADRLPDDVTAQLTFDELAQLLQFHLDYLAARGVARAQGDPDPDDVLLVAAEDDAMAFVIGRASEASLDVDDVTVVQVIEGNEEYLRAIGAYGPRLDQPDA